VKRSIQIIANLLAVLLLVTPFDCFASGKASHQAMECCLKGKCGPTAKADTCCKNTVPDGQLAVSKASADTTPLAVVTASAASLLVPPVRPCEVAAALCHPPPSALTARNLPLLI